MDLTIHDDESFERALKRFQRKCEKAGLVSEVHRHRHFEKPSERPKRKLAAGIRENRRRPVQ